MKEGHQPEIPVQTEGELPEFKIFDLMSSVGNGEHHALNLLVMNNGVIYSRNDHYREIMKHQEKGRGWSMNSSLPFNHCRRSLSPIGLATMEAVYPDGSVWGYKITPYGLTTGKSFAGCVLKWSYEHPKFSLYKMVGSTNSNSIKYEQSMDKKRAQETRYKIFWEIATNPSNRIRLTDIANAIKEDIGLVNDHLVSLNRNAVISYEATGRGESYSGFRRKEAVPDRPPKWYKSEKTLSIRLYDLLSKRFKNTPTTYLSTEEIEGDLIQEYFEYKVLDKSSLRKRIARTLTYFEKQGFIDRERFSYGFQSEITASDEQRQVIESFVALLDNVKNGDRQTLEEGGRFGERVLNYPQLFSELMLKAKEASPHANRTARENMRVYLLDILYHHPQSSVKQVQQILEEEYDKKLGNQAVLHYLNRLAQDPNSKITFEKTKFGNVYRVAEEDSQAPSSQN